LLNSFHFARVVECCILQPLDRFIICLMKTEHHYYYRTTFSFCLTGTPHWTWKLVKRA